MEWTTASCSICVSHSADVPLELHEGVCDEEVMLGGLAALQHHHECRGGAQRVGGRARDTGMDWGGEGGAYITLGHIHHLGACTYTHTHTHLPRHMGNT